MASLFLDWDNTPVNASVNAIAQRVSWRGATLGGAYSTTNITPSNDMAKTVNAAEFTAATDNLTYDLKVEAICTTGGPTINANGVQQGIVFACLAPSMTPEDDSVLVTRNLVGTDINKAKFDLRLQSDDSLVATQTVNRIGNTVSHTFSSLTPSTGYYFEITYYATVNGVEVNSADAAYLGDVCGGNIAGYTFTTDEPELAIMVVVDNNSTDISFNAIEINGLLIEPGSYPHVGEEETYPVLTGPTVTIYVEYISAVGGQSISIFDTNGALAHCQNVPAGTNSFTEPGIDATGPNDIEVVCNSSPC